MDPLEVFTRVACQQVTNASKVCSVFHFFYVNVSNIAFATDVGDCKSAIGHPFSNQVFFVLDVMITFSHHVVMSLDASIIIVVERNRDLCVGDGVSQG
jgi:hypothetical protein